MEALFVIALISAAGYLISLKRWPYTPCRRCQGTGRNAGSTRKRYGRCKRCEGSGRKPRLGTRVISRRSKRP
jgi:DnaJ-class molecular chaperone